MADNDEPKVADVQVETDEDSGTKTATITRDDGSTSTGSSTPGILAGDASTAEAIEARNSN
jgi:hypothetical protein